MEPVRGLAADVTWHPVLAASGQATVGSSFAHAVNIVHNHQFLTVLASSGRPAPGALITDAPSFPWFDAATEVQVHPGLVRLGSMLVDTTGCQFFSCTVGAVRARAVVPPSTLRRLRDGYAVRGSFVAAVAPSPFERALRTRLLNTTGAFQLALAATLLDGHATRLEPAVTDLVGLGVGLTPSGDDYLVGTLAALQHLPGSESVDATLPALCAAVSTAAVRTTTVSAHFLTAAADGRFHHDIAHAARAALTRTAAGVAAAFRDAVAIGSTSGTDAVFGLVDTLSTWHASDPVPSENKEFHQ